MTQAADKATARIDSIVESDVARGFRIRDVPANVQQILRDNGFVSPEQIKFLAMNASRRRDINEAVQNRYHKDLMDDAILSDAQIWALVEKRGQWSKVDDARREELSQRVQNEMLELWREGYADDGEAWRKALLEHTTMIKGRLRGTLSESEQMRFEQVFERWVSWAPEVQDRYTAEFASEQKLDAYRVDRDFQELLNLAPGADVADALNLIDDLRDKQRRLVKLVADMTELQKLNTRHARIFSGSAESRQSSTEELAQVYYACESLGTDGNTLGRLAPSFEEFFSWPHEAHKWFLYEAYFFHNDIPVVAARQYLETYGFLKAERPKEGSPGERALSDVSHVPLASSDDSGSAALPLPSSAAAMVTS
jgi:hypothetical protein